MKIIRLVILGLCALSMFLCSACCILRKEYECDINEVESIQIVRYERYNEEEDCIELTTLAEISDCAAFVEQLNEVEYSHHWTDPYVFFEGYVLVRINYYNGDYDLIHSHAQSFFRSEKVITGYFIFDEQFDVLVSEWLEKDRLPNTETSEPTVTTTTTAPTIDSAA